MAKKEYKAFDHASHNLKTHNYLKKAQEFPDWEITTAFYSSMKFIEGSSFPEEYLIPGKEEKNETKEYKNYNDYRRDFNYFCGGTPHDILKRFVKYNTDEDIHIKYNELYDICHTSRYRNYQVSQEDLNIAYEALEKIRLYCIKNQK